MKIPDPKFHLHQLVTLHWNEDDYKTRITKRIFNPDSGAWTYKVHCLNQEITADVLSPRS